MDRAAGEGGSTAKGSGFEKILLVVVLLVVGGALGYAAYLASGGRPEPVPERGDVVVVSKGDRVDLEAHAVAGKYTIYDFYADWCPPCRMLDARLRDLAAHHDNVAVRKIDIVDWTTPVVAQHGVEGLPYMVLYGPDGKRLAAGDDVYTAVSRIFQVNL